MAERVSVSRDHSLALAATTNPYLIMLLASRMATSLGYLTQNPMLTPPSIGSVTPVMNFAAGEAR